jgi:hypothetical protein
MVENPEMKSSDLNVHCKTGTLKEVEKERGEKEKLKKTLKI